MGARLSERLRAARLRRFVGREAERDLFLAALRAEEPPFYVLHVYGPSGIGKTTLLHTLASLCASEHARAVQLDGRNVDATPAAFQTALRAALDLPDDAALPEALDAAPARHVLLIDTYEMLAALDGWLREVFLPDLPTEMLVVTAGRNPMPPPWHADPGWQELLREVPLHAFDHGEGRTYLAKRQVDPDQHAAIMDFTHGHPLALSLVADLFEQQPGLRFQPNAAPDVIKALLDQFLQQVPGPAHRAALEACALVRVTNEALLAELLQLPEPQEIFDWLRRVSFIESGPYGLAPHDLARDALAADLRWRNPAVFADLHDRARTYYANRLEHTRGQQQQRVLSDYMYLHRDNPVIKPFIDWQDTGTAVPEPLTADDLPHLRAMVVRHEGEASARYADYWFEQQPEGVLVFRSPDRVPTGFLHMVALEHVTQADRKADPAIDRACGYLDAHAPLRSGERATHFRFWMAADSYQSVSPVQSMLLLKIAQHYLTTPDLAFSFFPCANPDFWIPFCTYIELEHLPDAGYEVEGRHYGVFGHDWRAVPPFVWLDHLATRELNTSPEPVEPTPDPPLAILDAEAFEAAVRDALRAYTRPLDLSENPLVYSRLVLNEAGMDADEAERIETLRRVLKETAELLQASPHDASFYRALDRTYFRPARSQEQAAEMLGLPYSTFRRHLKRGIDRLTEHLWQQETGL